MHYVPLIMRSEQVGEVLLLLLVALISFRASLILLPGPAFARDSLNSVWAASWH